MSSKGTCPTIVRPLEAIPIWLVTGPLGTKLAVGSTTPRAWRPIYNGFHVVDLDAEIQLTVLNEPGTSSWKVYCATLSAPKLRVVDIRALEFELEQGILAPNTLRILPLPGNIVERRFLWRQVCGGPKPRALSAN